nr:hypothetical protein [Tanacetum cinerariifolium]
MALTFADTHNMIAYLTKSDASEGFDQIIDFLNGSSIKYALTVNPNIYVSCIRQFWTFVLVKKVNDVLRLQALVGKKKVNIMEATIRDALRLDDAGGIDCLPNEEIFTELARMRYEKPSTKFTFYKNEFSSSLASAVICLSTAQVGDLSSHTTKYSSPALTQKVFANMRRVGKGFSRVDTPLFEGMLVAHQVNESATELNVDNVLAAGVADEGTAEVNVDVVPAVRVNKLERRNKLKVYKLRRLKKLGTAQRVDTSDDTVMDDVFKKKRMIADLDADVDVTLKDVADIAKEVAVDAKIKESADLQRRQAESQAQIYQIDLEHADKVLSIQDDKVESVELQEVVEVVTTAKLITEVVTAASATITATAP